jgi:hypothetical protein
MEEFRNSRIIRSPTTKQIMKGLASLEKRGMLICCGKTVKNQFN